MYKFTGFSESADTALNYAISLAQNLGHTYIGSEHLLLSLAKDSSSVAGIILTSRGIVYGSLLKKIRTDIGAGIPTRLSVEDISPRLKKIIESALSIGTHKEAFAGTEHLLIALLRERPGAAVRLIGSFGVSPQSLLNDINRSLSSESDGSLTLSTRQASQKNERQTLSKYSTDLTKAAREGKIDPVVCREKELERVIRILCRRTKNDPCLIGEPGVGKTAIAEALALKIVSGDVPDALKDKELYSLELTGMVAGAKYRGDFEERIRNAVNEVTSSGNIILFIDEIHNLIGAGAAEGAVDAANILKPMLARGELRIIGATTLDEYRKTIAKDTALERRFQTVTVDEPTEEECITILKALREKYEAHHGCVITDEAIKAAVELSQRYITDRFLPDKAIDLIDEAAAEVRIKSEGTDSAESAFTKETENDLTELSRLLKKPKAAQSEKSAREGVEGERIVTAANICTVVSEWTDIPVSKLSSDEKKKLADLEAELSQSVIGQEKAIKTVADAVIRGRTGIKDPKRPLGTFLFCGPTGVGKTELSKALASSLFGTKNALIRLDMSEYSEQHSVSRLIGSPPGYVGFEEGGQLTEQIRRKPYSVILFDEIEKAHPDIFNTLLQMLEDGILTSTDGRTVNCRNAIVIMTSNAGDRMLSESLPELGFTASHTDREEKAREKAVNSELKKIFRPEFLNRIDSIVVFGKLKREDMEKIARKMLAQLQERCKALGLELEFSPDFPEYCAQKNLNDKFGARPLRRFITDKVENPIAKAMLSDNGEIKKITVTVSNGEVVLI